jgi:hypothetical protein
MGREARPFATSESRVRFASPTRKADATRDHVQMRVLVSILNPLSRACRDPSVSQMSAEATSKTPPPPSATSASQSEESDAALEPSAGASFRFPPFPVSVLPAEWVEFSDAIIDEECARQLADLENMSEGEQLEVCCL